MQKTKILSMKGDGSSAWNPTWMVSTKKMTSTISNTHQLMAREVLRNPYYTFLDVTGYFRFSLETMKKMYSEGRVVKVGNGLQQKIYLKDAKETRKTDTTCGMKKY